MKKLFIFLTSLIAVFTIIIVKGISANAKSFDKSFEVIIGDGGGTGNNLSKFEGFVINQDLDKKIKLLGTGHSDTYSVSSTRNEVMGSVYTDYEYYRIGEGENNTYNIMVLYKSTMEPKDNVKYANGMGNWFTETGDACSEYLRQSIELNNIGSALYMGSEPTSTIITYTSKVSISYTYVTDANGNLYILPVIETSISATYPSVVVENNSSKDENKVDIKHKYTANDSYSMNASVQYGCFYFTIPTSSSSILLRLKTEGEFSIAEGGKWGSCWGTATGIHDEYITLS